MSVTARGIALAALKIALAYAAAPTHELGGNNRGDQVEFFQSLMGGNSGDPWCADFVCTCLVKGYALEMGLPVTRDTMLSYVDACGKVMVVLSGYCPTLAANAVKRYRLSREKGYACVPGDIVLYDFKSEGEPHHVGIIEHTQGALLHTVEGNTGSGKAGSQGDGDGVYRRTRGRGHVFGFIHWG